MFQQLQRILFKAFSCMKSREERSVSGRGRRTVLGFITSGTQQGPLESAPGLCLRHGTFAFYICVHIRICISICVYVYICTRVRNRIANTTTRNVDSGTYSLGHSCGMPPLDEHTPQYFPSEQIEFAVVPLPGVFRFFDSRENAFPEQILFSFTISYFDDFPLFARFTKLSLSELSYKIVRKTNGLRYNIACEIFPDNV